jgi:hypothetical protein
MLFFNLFILRAFRSTVRDQKDDEPDRPFRLSMGYRLHPASKQRTIDEPAGCAAVYKFPYSSQSCGVVNRHRRNGKRLEQKSIRRNRRAFSKHI